MPTDGKPKNGIVRQLFSYGGVSAMKALSAPFPQVRFLPTGGVDLKNIKEYLSFDKIAAVGGSFMMKGDIRANCKQLMEVLNA